MDTACTAAERIWEDMYAEEALARLTALEDTDSDLSRPALQLAYRSNRMGYWQDYVERMHLGRRAA